MIRVRRAIALLLLLIATAARAESDPLAAIGGLLRTGQVKEARLAAASLRDQCVARADGPGEAVAWLLLGVADSMLHDPAAVRIDFEKAAAKFAATEDPMGGWLTLLMLGKLESTEGQFDASIAAYERAAALLREAKDSSARFSLDTFKAFATAFGMPTDSLGPLLDYPDLLKPILLRFADVMSADAYAAVLLEAGNLEKAEEQLARASETASLFGGMFDASIEAHRGTLRQRQWRFDEARASYRKALGSAALLPKGWIGMEWIEVDLMGQVAELEVLSGRTDEGLAWNDRALERVRMAKNVRREAALLEARGSLLKNGGRIDAAQAAFEHALEFALKNGATRTAASIHVDLGGVHMFQGRYGRSLEHLESAIALYQTLNEPYLEAPVWALMAEVHLLLESPDGAQLALDNARGLARKSGFKLAEGLVDMISQAKRFHAGEAGAGETEAAVRAWLDMPEARALMFNEQAQRTLRDVITGGSPSMQQPEHVATPGPPFVRAMALMLKGKAHLERGEWAAAREVLTQALSVNPSADHRAGLLAMIGASHSREGNRAEAIRFFREAAATLDASAVDVKVEELLTSYLGSGRRWYFELLIDLLVEDGQTRDAFAHAERARARAFLQLVGNNRLRAEQGADPQLVREAEALRTHIAERERGARNAQGDEAKRIAADLERERQRYRTVMTRVKLSNPEYAALTAVEPLQIETVQNALAPDVTLISYFVSPGGVHAWTIDRTAVRHEVLPIDRAALRRIVCWGMQFAPPDEVRGVVRPGAGCSGTATAEEAYDALIAPLLDGVRNRKLLLVPHGALHYVPFAALRSSRSGCHLIEEYTLTYAPSASAIPFLQAKESSVDGGALILGDPETPLPALRKLPGAKEEAASIARRLGGTARLGADARESLLYATGSKADLVHIAAHGLYDAANPLFSRVALAPGDSHDGSLTVHEILSSVDLTGVNLVVLSACRSAAGARSGGDEVVGLTRALLYAGTPGVISTLWNIDDAASAGLMDAFYRHLGRGDSAAEALRAAQLEVLRSEQHSHPKYWAAFLLTGDPQGRWSSAEGQRTR